MHPHSAVEDYYRDAAHPPGVGPDGWGAGPVHPHAFPDRGAPSRYDDTPGSRPFARPARGFQGGGALQLRNGVAQLARTRLASPVSMFATKTTPANKHVLPGDRLVIPASRSQVDQWMAATAGAIPDTVSGNGSVVAGYPTGGGAY